MPHALCALGLLLLTLAPAEAAAQVVLSPTRYELEVEVDYPSEVLRGTARIAVENRSTHSAHQASLLLYRLLQVRSVRSDAGTNLAFSQTVVAFEDFGKFQANHIVIELPQPLDPGVPTTIRIQYEGPLLGYAETGMRYVQDRIDPDFTILRDDAYAYPRPGYPSLAVNRAAVPEFNFTYSARITVPKGLTVANGGRLEGVEAVDDHLTFRFSSLKPSWRMDFAIAKYGELSSGPVRVYYLPGDKAGAAGVVEAANKALDFFGRWFGPLRQSSVITFIEIPDGWGSQADVTTVIQTAAAFRDPHRHHEVYHEISHLWNAPPTDLPSPRWNEGLASFLEDLVDQEVTGKPLVDQRAMKLVQWLRGALPKHPEWKKVPLVDYGRADLTDLSYSVGDLFFDLLYRLVGRKTFNTIIGEYVAQFGTLGGSTNDFVEVIRKTAGTDVSQLVTDWIYTTGWADRIEHVTAIQDLEAYYRHAERK
jgi:aminopeptidase N